MPVTNTISRICKDRLRTPQGLPPDPPLRARPSKLVIMTQVVGMRVEVRVSSPEPAVGVFTTAGTCQGRLRRHFVIGCATP